MTLKAKILTTVLTLSCVCGSVKANNLLDTKFTSIAKTNESGYYIVNQEIDDFLVDLARDSGTRIHATDHVRGRIKGHRLDGDVSDILENLSTFMELDWFKHNGVFFLSNRSEALTRMIRLGDLSVSDTIRELETSGLIFEDFQISATAENSALVVTGPPKYLALVESVIESIPSEKPEERLLASKTIKVRRGLETTSEVVK